MAKHCQERFFVDLRHARHSIVLNRKLMGKVEILVRRDKPA
jgi:hypothetical protein